MHIPLNGITINYWIDSPASAPWITMRNSLAMTRRMWNA